MISGYVSESTESVGLRNHKGEGVEVMPVDPVGDAGDILSSTYLFEQTDAWTLTLLPRWKRTEKQLCSSGFEYGGASDDVRGGRSKKRGQYWREQDRAGIMPTLRKRA
ncbi:MAG: hypothetical protein OSA81_10730 [Longimicrobiales bacterium]|nr:hypothetical protein [Longimicrobiales bacterium]